MFDTHGMSTLGSALEEFRFSDVCALGDEQLASDLDELEHAERVIHSERSRRIAEIERGDGSILEAADRAPP